ncbi:MAG: sugar transferase [Candidatus Hydrothermales bacterium]
MSEIFERLLALLMLFFLLPFIVVIAIIIMYESKGKPFFKQRRVGKGKKAFYMYKFRTMYVDQEEKLKDFLEKNLVAREEWNIYRKIRGIDPRVTKTGKWLRIYSLDEIPQLYNIFRGEMSFVGPRPYLMEELNRFLSEDEIIFSVKPGLTGLWQISGRNKLTFRERIELDKIYIKKKKFIYDLLIIIKTIKAVISKEGAY